MKILSIKNNKFLKAFLYAFVLGVVIVSVPALATYDNSPKLVLSHITCGDSNDVEVHFVVNHLPSHVANYGQVDYTLNGDSRTASFDKRVGDVAHYHEHIPVSGTSYSVTIASVAIDGDVIHLENPQTITVSGCGTPPPGECELEIVKTVNKDVALIGDSLTYTLTVKNIGDADCTGGGVKVKDVVDNHLHFESETHSSGIYAGYNGIPLYTSSTRTLLWDANILNPGETQTITWHAEVKEPASCGSFEIENQAFTTSREYSNFSIWEPSNTVVTDVLNSCPPVLAGECSVDPSSAELGDVITFSASATGGDGSYTYSWTGTNGLSGSTAEVDKTYSTTGTKTGTVTVSSGGHSITKSCSVVISALSCDISPAPGRIIVDFSPQRIASYPIGSLLTETTAISTSIPAGSYVVTAHSFDAYSSRINTTQLHEQWFGVLKSGGTEVVQTGTISDVADRVAFASVTEEVNTSASPLVVPTAVTSVLARHAYIGDNSPNSVYPSCIAFDPVYIPPPGECELEIVKTVNKDVALIGDSLTYTLTVKNIGDADCTGGGVKVKDVVDNHLHFESETHSSGIYAGYNGIPLYTSSTRTLLWDANILNPGETQTITWHAEVKEPASCGSFEIENQAFTTSREYSNFSIWEPSNTVVTDVAFVCPPELIISCEVDPETAFIGEDVEWSTTATGGTGSYTYSWTGTDGLSGNLSSFIKSYTSVGVKLGEVTVTSGTETESATCAVVINEEPPPALEISCDIDPDNGQIGDTIEWSATATGGDGSYTYSWSGTDGLSGNTDETEKIYYTTGTKTGTVSVTSGDETLTESCEVTITPVACQIPPTEGRIIVDFNDERLISYGPVETSAVSTSIPAGVYAVTLSSYDAYASRINVVQPHEQWLAVLFNGSTEIALSGVVGDVPDNVAFGSITEDVNTVISPLVVSTPITSVLARHAFIADNNPNSVIPICASFTPIDIPPPALEGDCLVNPAAAQVGDSVEWSATADGGTGSYTYSWTGTDGLSGNTDEVDKTYTTAGTKTATVTIVSGTQSVTASCEIPITETPPELDGECTVDPSSADIGDVITWDATASGGDGSYTYSWTGTDGLSGNTDDVDKTYTTAGTKTGTVTIESGDDSITRSCDVIINDPPPAEFSAQCTVTPSLIHQGDSATWSASAVGGTGSYTYEWTGTDGLSGTTADVVKTYGFTGSKNGSVTVVSGSDVITASCSLTVINPPGGCTTNCGGGGFNPPTVVLLKNPPEGRVLSAVYLSQVPYTGIGDWYKIPLFLLILGLWSASIVYFFRSKLWEKKQKAYSGMSQSIAGNSSAHDNVFDIKGVEVEGEDPWLATNTDPSDQSISNDVEHEKTDSSASNGALAGGIIDVIAAEAQSKRTVISEEGMRYVAEKSDYDAARALSSIESLIRIADTQYDRDDGWLLLNKEKVMNVLSGNVKATTHEHLPYHTEVPEDVSSTTEVKSETASSVGNNETIPGHAFADSSTFVSWIASGDKTQIVRYMKELRGRSGGLESFLKKVILDLDVVFRSRFEDVEEAINERLAQTTAGLSNAQLEELIATLVSTTDQNYRSTSLNVKLALMRASQIGK